MPAQRSILRPAVLALLVAAGCTSTPAPSGSGARPSAVEPSATLTATSAAASASPSAIAGSSPAATPEPTSSPSATASEEPSAAPSDEPTAPPDAGPTPLPAPRMAAGCPTGQDWLSASPDRVPKTLAFGHATIEFTSAGISLLDGSHAVDDAIPGGVGLSPTEIAVVVAPGEHVILRAAWLTLSDVNPAAGPWSQTSFEGGLANLPRDLTALAWRFRPDGSISISAPTEPGDYAVSFDPRWFGACLAGDGTAYGRLKVIAP